LSINSRITGITIAFSQSKFPQTQALFQKQLDKNSVFAQANKV